MARAPDAKEQEAKALYKKGMKLIDISKQLEIPEGTVRRWKCTHKWDSERSENKTNVRKKPGAPKNNKNAIGHGAPDNNKNAEKHGLFTKWLPEETVKIIGEMASTNPLDLLWNNILLQQAAILRAQNIMHVTDKNEIIKEVTRTKEKIKDRKTDKTTTTESEIETEYAFQFAWDRQATYLSAQSRAYTTLNSMIKQYDEMLHKDWDMATEEQKARIEALKKQAGNGQVNTENTGIVLMPDILPEDGGHDE
jgi:uncharacterized protein YjcR